MRAVLIALRTFFKISLPYFRSEEKWRAGALLVGVVGAELALVYVAVLVNQWNARFYNALEARNWTAFQHELVVFATIAGAAVISGMAQFWLGQKLQIGWRRWMTQRYIGEWMADGRHYRMRFTGEKIDNVHLRIAEDVQYFVMRTHELGTGLLGSVVALISFAVILWGLSATTPFPLFGTNLQFAGYLIVIALVYATIGTLVTHMIGRPLIELNFDQQRREQDFRFALNRVADNSEPVALLGGESVERRSLGRHFAAVVGNWVALVARQTRLTGFTYGYSQVSIVFPVLVASPAYLAGAIPLGTLMQTASAFQRVEGAFAYFIAMYSRLAEWKAMMDRLGQFESALARVDVDTGRSIRLASGGAEFAVGSALTVENLVVRLPSGAAVATLPELVLAPGDRLLVTGPSGAGKSMIFRAFAGLWPVGEGRITLPAGTDVLVIPQRPYFPIGSLESALAYPLHPEDIPEEAMREVLAAVGLARLAERLGEQANWSDELSGGEQARIGFARAILRRPSLLLLDETASALDETTARALYRLLLERLPRTTIVSIGRAEPLAEFHDRTIAVEVGPRGLALDGTEKPAVPA